MPAEPVTPLVTAQDVHVQFRSARRRVVKAVDGVDLAIDRGAVLGLVGESGCGKSTLGRALIGLRPLSAGEVRFEGSPLGGRPSAEFRRKAQIVFQDPYGSLNPRMTIGSTLAEPIRYHHLAQGPEIRSRVGTLLELVGLPQSALAKYPHEFSGGQRQRVAIARALAMEPSFIVCDEPISALDVSIQAQVINLLQELKENLSLTYLFISHDLASVARMSTRVAVMYLGRIVESGSVRQVYGEARHPYTRMLLSAVPSSRRSGRAALRTRIKPVGEPPSPSDRPRGCAFRLRCPLYQELGRPSECEDLDPRLTGPAEGHQSACHFTAPSTDETSHLRSEPE